MNFVWIMNFYELCLNFWNKYTFKSIYYVTVHLCFGIHCINWKLGHILQAAIFPEKNSIF